MLLFQQSKIRRKEEKITMALSWCHHDVSMSNEQLHTDEWANCLPKFQCQQIRWLLFYQVAPPSCTHARGSKQWNVRKSGTLIHFFISYDHTNFNVLVLGATLYGIQNTVKFPVLTPAGVTWFTDKCAYDVEDLAVGWLFHATFHLDQSFSGIKGFQKL